MVQITFDRVSTWDSQAIRARLYRGAFEVKLPIWKILFGKQTDRLKRYQSRQTYKSLSARCLQSLALWSISYGSQFVVRLVVRARFICKKVKLLRVSAITRTTFFADYRLNAPPAASEAHFENEEAIKTGANWFRSVIADLLKLNFFFFSTPKLLQS